MVIVVPLIMVVSGEFPPYTGDQLCFFTLVVIVDPLMVVIVEFSYIDGQKFSALLLWWLVKCPLILVVSVVHPFIGGW